VWRPSSRLSVGLLNPFPHAKAFIYIDANQIGILSDSALLGLGKEKTTLAPATQWTALVEVVFIMAFH